MTRSCNGDSGDASNPSTMQTWCCSLISASSLSYAQALYASLSSVFAQAMFGQKLVALKYILEYGKMSASMAYYGLFS